MPKNSKKRRRKHYNDAAQQQRSLSFQIAGLSSINDAAWDNSIESCLHELEGISTGRIQKQKEEEEEVVPLSEAIHRSKKKKKKKTEGVSTVDSDVGDKQKTGQVNSTKVDDDFKDVDDNEKLWDPTLGRRSKDLDHHRIKNWNTALSLWMSSKGGGTYTPGLLPSFEVEVARHFQVEQLSSFLLGACDGRLKMPSFERWLIDSKVEERKRASKDGETYYTVNPSDPVLSYSTPGFQSTQRLMEEMRETGMSQEDAKQKVKDLCRRTEVAINELMSQTKRYARKIPLKKGDRIDIEHHEQIYSLVFTNKTWKKPFVIRIAASHYNKLREMFLYVHNQSGSKIRFTEGGKATKALHAFHYLIMTVLVRYSSLSGGQLLLDLRGGGMQGAIHGEAFRVLRHCFANDGPMLECFASPLNGYLPSFCSAFPDMDWHFGSVGDFLTTHNSIVASGCCEANPPFTPGLMGAMVDRIECSIREADRKQRSLSFVVVVPTVPDDLSDDVAPAAKRLAGPAFRRMISSPNCRLHIILSAREHGYIEGAQHLRLTRYKYSIFDTSVILLQSQRERQQPLDEHFEDRLRQAFASKHTSELEKRQSQQQEEDEGTPTTKHK